MNSVVKRFVYALVGILITKAVVLCFQKVLTLKNDSLTHRFFNSSLRFLQAQEIQGNVYTENVVLLFFFFYHLSKGDNFYASAFFFCFFFM